MTIIKEGKLPYTPQTLFRGNCMTCGTVVETNRYEIEIIDCSHHTTMYNAHIKCPLQGCGGAITLYRHRNENTKRRTAKNKK